MYSLFKGLHISDIKPSRRETFKMCIFVCPLLITYVASIASAVTTNDQTLIGPCLLHITCGLTIVKWLFINIESINFCYLQTIPKFLTLYYRSYKILYLTKLVRRETVMTNVCTDSQRLLKRNVNIARTTTKIELLCFVILCILNFILPYIYGIATSNFVLAFRIKMIGIRFEKQYSSAYNCF